MAAEEEAQEVQVTVVEIPVVTGEDLTKAARCISVARMIAMKKAPYFAVALQHTTQAPAIEIPTVAITPDVRIYYNPLWVQSISLPELAGVLVHELHHVIRDHAGRADSMGIKDAHRKLWNIAGDLEINDDLEKGGWKLPEGGMVPEKFGMDPGQVAEKYFIELLKIAKKNGLDDPKLQSQGVGAGQCGSGAGNPTEGEGDAHKRVSKDLGDNEADGGTSDLRMEKMRKDVANEIQGSGKHAGSIPAGLKRWADDMLKAPTIPWQQRLARVARHVVTYQSGMDDYWYGAPSRRQAAVGFGHGKPVLASMYEQKVEVAFVLDTSGSMGQDGLSSAMSEAHGVFQAAGAQVTFISADAAVHSFKRVRSVKEAVSLIRGGGGTDFIPAFEKLARSRPRPNVIVYATDGYGRAPDVEPAWCSTIWLLVGQYTQTPAPWGRTIKVD
jgi:predicted metal-dependent peptidase